MSAEETVTLPDLTPAQEDALRKKWGLPPGTPTASPQTAETAYDQRPVAHTFVVTNLMNADLTLPDLGYKLPGGGFEPFTFKPYQCVDLLTLFKRRDIENSRYLRQAVAADPPQLKLGQVDREVMLSEQDPLSRRVREHMGTEGAFPDTSPLALKSGEGETEFDKRLAELRVKEEQEERDTRK